MVARRNTSWRDKVPKFDITNPMTCDRVIHDVNKRPVHVVRGETKFGVELDDATADRLQKLAATGNAVELTLTPAAATDDTSTTKPVDKPTLSLKK